VNWDALGAIAEALGAAGVIATLVYLSLQVRRNSKEILESRTQRVFELMIETRSSLAEGKIAPIQAKIEANGELTPEEEIRYRAHRAYNLNIWNAYLVLSRSGTISSDLHAVMTNRMRQGLSGPTPLAVKNRQLWKDTPPGLYTDEFQVYINEIVREE
jgi:hypothetical protein